LIAESLVHHIGSYKVYISPNQLRLFTHNAKLPQLNSSTFGNTNKNKEYYRSYPSISGTQSHASSSGPSNVGNQHQANVMGASLSLQETHVADLNCINHKPAFCSMFCFKLSTCMPVYLVALCHHRSLGSSV